MPISRDARTDRRRRLLRDATEDNAVDSTSPKRISRRTPEVEESDGTALKRKAGYSQDVRKACGQRLVQLIPVRRRSFAAVIFVSLLIPGLLLAAHYMIHVTGQLQWWRHPLAVAMDIGHPRSIAAWLSSQLWLLCLAATVLTFQLRRHKLDDYNGEYRLWFWLVLTCLIASVDATTSITELFAMALDPWAQTHLGWSGPAVVDATMTVLIGMLGLRMCSELKSVPLSLICWLIGLVAWGGSAALARPEFRLEMSAPIRYWLTAALWLGGLTMIWLAALTYLRSIYVEAQKRFLLRGRLAASGVPLRQRLRESLPNMPRLRRDQSALPATDDTRRGLSGFLKRSRSSQVTNDGNRPTRDDQETEPATLKSSRKSRFGSWIRRAKDSDDAEEYRKVSNDSPAEPSNSSRRDDRAAQPKQPKTSKSSDATAAQPRTARRWLPKLSRPKMSIPSLPRPKLSLPKFTRAKSETPSKPKTEKKSLLSRFKLPSLSLSALKLQPPDDSAAPNPPALEPREVRPVVNTTRPLPGTNPIAEPDDYFDDEEQDGRPLSKAERKRLRRNQQQRRSA